MIFTDMDRQTFFGHVARGSQIRKADYKARTSLEVCQFNAMAKADSYFNKTELMAMPDFDEFWCRWWNETLVPKGFPEISVDEYQEVVYRKNVEYMRRNFLK